MWENKYMSTNKLKTDYPGNLEICLVYFSNVIFPFRERDIFAQKDECQVKVEECTLYVYRRMTPY